MAKLTNTAQQLLGEIDAFLENSGMAATAFGLAAVNDGHLVRDLRDGKAIGFRRIDKVREFIASHKKRRREVAA